MIPLNDDLIDALAAEYVLGTQSERIRKRMSTLMVQEARLAERVDYWQSQLNQLSEAARPVPVPPWVWRRIEAQINPDRKDDSEGTRSSWWQSLVLWRWTTGLATAMAVLLTLLPSSQIPPDAPTAQGGVVLVLTDEESKTAWLVSRISVDSPVKAHAVGVPVMTVEQAYELWLLPPDGVPLSLGLLNDQGNTELLPARTLAELVKPGLAMAVSIEPPGGSPTGAPTGPVVYTGSIRSL